MDKRNFGIIRQALALCVCGFMFSLAHASDDKYTMEDLRALDQQNGFEEIVGHMYDIHPSQRTEVWKKVVTRAVVNAFDKELAGGDPYAALVWSEQTLQSMPSLKESKEFIGLRKKAIFAGAAQCYRDYYGGSECTESLRKAVLQSPVDSELAFKAGKMVRLHMNASAAVPFFIQALKPSPDSELCQDPDVFLAVESGMGSSGEASEAATELGFSVCFNKLKSQLLEEFYSSSGYALENYCAAFSQKKLLTAFQTAYCSDQN